MITACRLHPEPAVFTGWLEGLWARLYESWEASHVQCEGRFPAILRGAAASDLPRPAAVAAIGVPTLVLAWATDDGHPVSTATRLGELLPSSQVEVADHAAVVARWPTDLAAFLSTP